MAHHLDEQEKIEQLKRFWYRYGKWLSIALAALIVGYIAHIAFDKYQTHRAHQAAELYVALETEISQNNLPKIESIAKQLIKEYPQTPYASRGALLLAKIYFLTGQIDQSKTQLSWVIDHSDEPALQSAAIVRLATLFFHEKDYKTALATLEKLDNAIFEGQALELKGDILRTIHQTAAAKKAYQAALDTLDANDPNRFLLNVKLGELGN